MSETARAEALRRSGVTWCAYWWQTYAEQMEGSQE